MRDLKVALVFLTRLPVRIDGDVHLRDLASAVYLFPLVGMIVGLAGGGTFALARLFDLGSLAAAIIAIAATVIVTGALHEDGLADTADALGAGSDRSRALDIMKDSRIGTFGTVALVLVLMAKIVALSAFWDPVLFTMVLVAAASMSRAVVPAVMLLQPSARAGGLAASAGDPEPGRVILSILAGAIIVLLLLPLAKALSALAASAIATLVVASLLGRRFGGCTGDTLGAVQQLCEVTFLLAVSAHA